MKRNSKGITLVALIITVIVMLILISISVEYGGNQIQKAKLEDTKTEMIVIKGKAQIIAEKNSFDNDSELKGEQQENGNYKLSENDLKEMGIEDIDLDNDSYYEVRYFTKDENDKDKIDVDVYLIKNNNIVYQLSTIDD